MFHVNTPFGPVVHLKPVEPPVWSPSKLAGSLLQVLL